MIAYVNPPSNAKLLAGEFTPQASFGSPGLIGPGIVGTTYELRAFLLAYLPAVVMPATLLLVSVWMAGAARRQRIERVLSLLGMQGIQRARLRLAAIAGPWAVGVSIAGLVLVILCAVDVSVPLIDFQLLSGDLRRFWLPLVEVWAAASVAALAALIIQIPGRRLIRNRRRDQPADIEFGAAGVGLAAIAAALPIVNSLPVASTVKAWASLLIMAIAIFTLPALCSVTVHFAAQRFRKSESIGTIVGSCLLRQGRSTVAHFTATLGTALCLLSIVNVFATVSADPEPQSRVQYEQSVGHVLVIGSSRIKLSELTDARIAELARGSDKFVLRVQGASDDQEGSARPLLFADATSLRGFSLQSGACSFAPDTPEMLLSTLEVDGEACPKPLRERPTGSESWDLILYSEAGLMNGARLADLMSNWFAPLPRIEVPGSYWATAAVFATTQMRWIPVLATMGLLLMVNALLLYSAADLAYAKRRIAGYLILGAPDGTAFSAMAVRLGVPTLVAMAYASILSLQRPLIPPDYSGSVSLLPFVAYCVAVILVVGAAIYASGRGAKKYLQDWRPGGQRV